jgi:ribonuclease R
VLLNVRSSFSEQAAEHHGVGAEVYARFSSPMREIVGIFVHKEAWEKQIGRGADALTRGPATAEAGVLRDDELCAQVVESANRAKDLQKRITREANRLVIDQWLGDDLDRAPADRPARTATIMGLTRNKAHVLLDQPPLEVKVYVQHLEQQLNTRISLDADSIALVREDTAEPLCRIGDAVTVRARGRDQRRDRWILELVPFDR